MESWSCRIWGRCHENGPILPGYPLGHYHRRKRSGTGRGLHSSAGTAAKEATTEMGHWYYISPEEYARAEANGVKRGTLESRIWQYGWKKELAITTPAKPLRYRKKWVALALESGISKRVFYNRVSKGWTPERASTQPLATKEDRAAVLRLSNPAKRIYPQELIDQAAANGVSRNTFTKRMQAGWSLERAASEPLVSRKESGRRGKAALKARHGDVLNHCFSNRNAGVQ